MLEDLPVGSPNGKVAFPFAIADGNFNHQPASIDRSPGLVVSDRPGLWIHTTKGRPSCRQCGSGCWPHAVRATVYIGGVRIHLLTELNMKRLLGLLGLLLGMVGCGEVKTVDVSKTVERGGLRYEINSETPFTGVVVVSKYENGQKAQETTYKDGKIEGLSTAWYDNGQKRSEYTYKDGIFVSKRNWYIDGNESK